LDAVIGFLLILVVALGAESPRPPVAPDADSTRVAAGASARSDSARSPEPVITLPEVRVDRDRALLDARRRLPTAFVSDLRAGASGHALETLSETLEQAAGVHIVEYGGLGAFSTVSLRGAPPGQVSIYLDGVPITSAAHGVVNLADLPITAVDRIEVYRGVSPLVLGAATPGGAINLITLSPSAVRELRVTRGSMDSWEARGTVGTRRRSLATLFHAGYLGSDGRFPFLDNNSTGAAPLDDEAAMRINNRFDAVTALGTVEWTPGAGVRARLGEDLFHKHQGLPGLGPSQADDTRLTSVRSLSHLTVERTGSTWTPGLRLDGALQRERTQFRDLGIQLGLGKHDTDDHIGGDNLGLALAWPALPLGFDFEGGGALRREFAHLRDPVDGVPDPPESERHASAAHAVLRYRPLRDWLTLQAGRRWDRISDHLRSSGVAGTTVRSDVTRTLDSPQLGARFATPLGLELKANWSESARPPDFLELFGNQGSVLGNPKLLPERGENHDFGAAWSTPRAARLAGGIEWSRFVSHARDMIVYVMNSPSTIKATNISRALIRGDEVSLRLTAGRTLSLTGAMTWMSSVDQGDFRSWRGRTLPQRPDREGYARLGLTRGRFEVSGDLHAIGKNYLDRYNLHVAGARALAGASVSYTTHREGLRVVVEGKNLGDRRVADVGGYPLPGRSFFVSCRAQFGASASRSSAP
jgi:iron complex outermembrane receptor protein